MFLVDLGLLLGLFSGALGGDFLRGFVDLGLTLLRHSLDLLFFRGLLSIDLRLLGELFRRRGLGALAVLLFRALFLLGLLERGLLLTRQLARRLLARIRGSAD